MIWARNFAAWLFVAGTAFGSGWNLTRNDHFDVYSDSSTAAARSAIDWLELLRSFLILHGGDSLDRRAPVLMVGFQSVPEYERYRLDAATDAYYIGTESHDYIVMPLGTASPADLRMLTHEYAHVLTHSGGQHWPAWFVEGFSEFLSTLRTSPGSVSVAGDLPGHSLFLQRQYPLNLADFLRESAVAPSTLDRRRTALFYAQSWALVEMLVLSPQYASRLPLLLSKLGSGAESLSAFTDVYAKSPTAIDHDLWRFIVGPKRRLTLQQPETFAASITQTPISLATAQSRLAELILAHGDLDRAAAMYRELVRNNPDNADFAAALGMIALRERDLGQARRLWNQAIPNVSDAALCYRYAVLAADAGAPDKELRVVLERAVSLNPDFDDARYMLATVDESLGDPETAVDQFRQMRFVAPFRAFSYWTSLSNALNELGRNAEAFHAIERAAESATTPEQRKRAARMAYLAKTEFTVQMATDSDGRPSMVGARKPIDSDDWNPFVEPGEEVRSLEAKLLNMECGGGGLRVRVAAGSDTIDLRIADPGRVRMRNAPAQFVCGPQHNDPVTIDYVASEPGAGLIRGMTFR
jgi:tetratricopeptide (TPR) repeat protein